MAGGVFGQGLATPGIGHQAIEQGEELGGVVKEESGVAVPTCWKLRFIAAPAAILFEEFQIRSTGDVFAGQQRGQTNETLQPAQLVLNRAAGLMVELLGKSGGGKLPESGLAHDI